MCSEYIIFSVPAVCFSTLFFPHEEDTYISVGKKGHLPQVINFENSSPSPVSGQDYEFWLSHSLSLWLSSVPPSPVNLLSCLFVCLSLVCCHLPLILLPFSFSLSLSLPPPSVLPVPQCPRQPGMVWGPLIHL